MKINDSDRAKASRFLLSGSLITHIIPQYQPLAISVVRLSNYHTKLQLYYFETFEKVS